MTTVFFNDTCNIFKCKDMAHMAGEGGAAQAHSSHEPVGDACALCVTLRSRHAHISMCVRSETCHERQLHAEVVQSRRMDELLSLSSTAEHHTPWRCPRGCLPCGRAKK